jgi:ATP-dependent DNA helicase RecG
MSRYNSGSTYNKFTRTEFLEKLRIISNGELSYSGLLLLGKNDAIQDHFPDFRVDYIEVPGNSYADGPSPFSFRLPEQENLWEYYFTILDRLRKHIDIPINITIEGFASEVVPQLSALREALVNFLMHADFFSPMKPRIRVFDNRIEFLNPGAPPKSIESFIREDILLPRNPILAKLFHSVRLAENAGTGFTKMIRGWQIFRGQPPVFHQEIDYTLVTFWLTTEVDQQTNIFADSSKKGGVSGSLKTSEKTGKKIVLSKKQRKIVALLTEDNSRSF